MSKTKKFSTVSVKKISGGKDPVNLIEEFILRQGFDPDACQKEKTGDHVRWMLQLKTGDELEILVEGLKYPTGTILYLGVNIVAVPIRGAFEVVTAALEIADSLVGIKVSLVGHYLVLSATMGLSGMDVDEIEYYYQLIDAQKEWFQGALSDELGWSSLEEN